MKKGRAGTMTHDYKRHGTTTLFATLNVLDGTVIGRNMQRHRHQEFVRFLNAVEAEVPAGKVAHAIVDNYATHKHPKVRKWLTAHPRKTIILRNFFAFTLLRSRRFLAKNVIFRYCPNLLKRRSTVGRWVRENHGSAIAIEQAHGTVRDRETESR